MSLLLDPHGKKLGDKLLSPEEALKKSFEDTEKKVARYRLDDHDHLKDAAQRTGKPMSHQDLIRRVTKCNPRIWAEDSLNDKKSIGFYTTRAGVKKYLVAFEKGVLPEFSFILVDTADLPIKEKRGWRTVLHRLLAQGALKWSDIVAIFGDVDGDGARTQRWHRNTKKYRN